MDRQYGLQGQRTYSKHNRLLHSHSTQPAIDSLRELELLIPELINGRSLPVANSGRPCCSRCTRRPLRNVIFRDPPKTSFGSQLPGVRDAGKIPIGVAAGLDVARPEIGGGLVPLAIGDQRTC